MQKRGVRRAIAVLLALVLGAAGGVTISRLPLAQNGPQLVADPGASGGTNGG